MFKKASFGETIQNIQEVKPNKVESNLIHKHNYEKRYFVLCKGHQLVGCVFKSLLI